MSRAPAGQATSLVSAGMTTATTGEDLHGQKAITPEGSADSTPVSLFDVTCREKDSSDCDPVPPIVIVIMILILMNAHPGSLILILILILIGIPPPPSALRPDSDEIRLR